MNSWRINEHFGHANEFLIYQVSDTGVEFRSVRKVAPYCTGAEHCDEDDSVMQGILAALADCRSVLSAKIGMEPWQKLEAAGIQPNGDHGWQPIEEALKAVYQELADGGRLTRSDSEQLRGAV